MRRKMYSKLLEWKQNNIKNPLMIVGARQIGKTYLIDKFCKNEYKNYYYINLLDREDIIELFERKLATKEKYEELILKFNITDKTSETIVFIDEIQESEELISSLKFFAESEYSFKIICAGSLLGVKINRFSHSFPVGKVNLLNMYPMDFEEFLLANDLDNWIEEIKKSFQNNKSIAIHNELLKYYRYYLCTGGMPKSILELIESQYDIVNFKGTELDYIVSTYIADMTKYIYNKTEGIKIEQIYKSIPNQLGNESNKFQYSKILPDTKKGKREYSTPLEWLISSKLIYKTNYVKKIEIPLTPFIDDNIFKLYLNDVGILNYLLKIRYNDIMLDSNFMYKGIIAENFVATQLSFNNVPLYYWHSGNEAEIDFLLYTNDGIIPIEVKAGDRITSKSLNSYIQKYNPKYSIRISTKNFGLENDIKSVPIYATFCINGDM